MALSKSLREAASHDKILDVEVFVSGLKTEPFHIRKTYVILPAYNEREALTRLIPHITRQLNALQRPFHILVVNDGSNDDTSSLLRSPEATGTLQELRHETNQGYGAALKTGLLWIAEHADPEDAVITLDADNTHDPIYISPLLLKLEEGCDAVTASYTMLGGRATGVPWLRRLMSSFVNAWFRCTFGLPGVRTYTNGFRAYRTSAVKAVYQKYAGHLMDETGFPGGTEFFLKIAGLGGRLSEIPFQLHYENRGTSSKIRLAATIRNYLKLVLTGRRYARP